MVVRPWLSGSVGCSIIPSTKMIVGLIPSQVVGLIPGRGPYESQLINLSLPLPQINKHIYLGEDKEKVIVSVNVLDQRKTVNHLFLFKSLAKLLATRQSDVGIDISIDINLDISVDLSLQNS